MPQNNIVVAVKAVLLHGRRALVLHRSATAHHGAGIWEHAGGKLEFGEGLQQALLREIKEETGLDAQVEKLLYAVTLLTSPQRQVVVLCYLCRAATANVTLSHEHDGYLWAGQNQMLERLDGDIIKNLLEYKVFEQIDIEK